MEHERQAEHDQRAHQAERAPAQQVEPAAASAARVAATVLDVSALTARCPTHFWRISTACGARVWAEGEGLALEEVQSLGDGEVLRILVEKDLTCLIHRSGEDDADAFPNPAEHC